MSGSDFLTGFKNLLRVCEHLIGVLTGSFGSIAAFHNWHNLPATDEMWSRHRGGSNYSFPALILEFGRWLGWTHQGVMPPHH